MAATAFALARQHSDRQLLQKAHAMTPVEALATLEDAGWITPRCPECAWVYKDAINVAARLSSNPHFRPGASHVASPACLRDRKPHCGCGRCTDRGAR